MSGMQPKGTTGTVKLSWHERPLPAHLTADEVRFFRNWSKELAGLQQVLTSALVDLPKVLRRTRRVYFKLAHKLIEEIRLAAVSR